MKTKFRLLPILMVLALSMISLVSRAQVGSLTQTGAVTVCLNSTESYGVMPTAGSTYTWTILAGSGAAGAITNGSAPNNLITINWTSAGTCTLQVIETSATCTGNPVTIAVTVLPGLNPGTLSSDQSICYNTIPAELTATAPTGGSGTYTYQWEYSIDAGTTWVPVATATALAFQPAALTQTTRYHLVQASSGSCGVVTTNVITISVQGDVVTSQIYHN